MVAIYGMIIQWNYAEESYGYIDINSKYISRILWKKEETLRTLLNTLLLQQVQDIHETKSVGCQENTLEKTS